MRYALITGSGGLIGSEAVSFLASKDYTIIGIDNNMRATYFGKEASTSWNIERLQERYKKQYLHYNVDIRKEKAIYEIFQKYSFEIIIHTAGQPSHDWSATNPITDFAVNANGTLIMLEGLRKYSPNASFIFTSTNKVYGDLVNYLPYIELEKRYELPQEHIYYDGLPESISIDQSLHTVFGVSKIAADVMVQEYGRFFGLNTSVFRSGCLTGHNHSSSQAHGFLAYLVKCVMTEKTYTINGYKGKQVRDNLHAYDLVNMFWSFHENPKKGAVYNVGGSRYSNISILEAISKIEELSQKKGLISYIEKPRVGDHQWYISSINKFQSDYPEWKYTYDIDRILEDIYKHGHFK
ncbi:MAG: NAD-dependent epimerase/dehydratase family protein [Candidatus Roizmanbacteria bacterium]